MKRIRFIALGVLFLWAGYAGIAFADRETSPRWEVDGTNINVIEPSVTDICLSDGVTCALASAGAPTNATYITQTPNGDLSAEQALSALSSGIMRVATTTGVVTSLTDSAGIAANVDDETGTGVMVFNITPSLTTPAIGAATGTSLDLGGTTLFASRQITVDTGGVLDINMGGASGDDFTIDTTSFVVEGDTGNVGIGTTTPTSKLHLPLENDAATPTISFGDGDSGFYEVGDDTIGFSTAANIRFKLSGNGFQGDNATAAQILNEPATSTNPTLVPNRADMDTGIGHAATDSLSLIAGGVEAQRLTETLREIEANATVCETDGGDLRVVTVATHALSVDTAVEFADGTGGVCTNIVAGTDYYVSQVDDANKFNISATRGGGNIAFSDAGTAFTSSELGITLTTYGTAQTILPQSNDPATPSLAFGNGNTGFYEISDDNLRVAFSGAERWDWSANLLSSGAANAAGIQFGASTSINPGLVPDAGDLDTGIGQAAEDQLSLIAGGVEGIRIAEAGSAITSVAINGPITLGANDITTTGSIGRDTDNELNWGTDDSLAFAIGGTTHNIVSISDGAGDNDKLVTQGYVDDNSGTPLTGITEATGNDNTVALGAQALDSLTTGQGLNNTAVGFDAGTAVTSADDNTLMGYQAGDALTTGDNNVAIGSAALGAALTTGNDDDNVAIGYNALLVSNGAQDNVCIGSQACDAVTTADNIVAVGRSALGAATDSTGNTAIGYHALDTLSTGANQNTSLGYDTGQSVTSGDDNTLIGFSAGDAITTGSGNTVIGASADVSAAGAANELAIWTGAGALITGDGDTPEVDIIAALTANTITSDGAVGGTTATFTADPSLTLGADSAADGTAVLYNATNSNTVTIQSGATSGTYALTLPLAVAGAGEFLTDSAGDGVLSWAAAGGGGVPKKIWATIFESLAGGRFINTGSDNGTGIVNNVGLNLSTSATSGGRVEVRGRVGLSTGEGELDSPSFSIFMDLDTKGTDADTYFGFGQPTLAAGGITYTDDHIGFKITWASSGTATLFATQADGATENASSALTTVVAGDELALIAKVNGTSSVDYYWRKNGSALSSATNLTSNMSDSAANMMDWAITNNSNASLSGVRVYSSSYER